MLDWGGTLAWPNAWILRDAAETHGCRLDADPLDLCRGWPGEHTRDLQTFADGLLLRG